ncbi:hypothetical protein [Stutzerimonas azotifigens]|uniref:hypothetical protein n=1 Tax=Stutzerimonas azotifigens TaxID=291995 RepID=UPI000402949F|nr:hypothetical protein [Stutzerimonas azotifigens]
MLIFENDYLLAWIAYGIASLGCLLVWFRMTRPLWRWLREPLRLLVAVLLLTPTIVDPARELFAPAIAITALDLLFKVGNNAWRAVADLALYGIIAFSLYLALVALRWPLERRLARRRAERGEAAAEDDPRTLRERMAEQDENEPEPLRYPNNGRLRTEPRL